MVDAYGQPTPINQVGTVNVPEPRMVTINVWDKSLVGKVEKAIRESGLGINPQLNGTIIMLPIPELNEERRKRIDEGRRAIRRTVPASPCATCAATGWTRSRRRRPQGMSEDDQKLWETEVQELTDSAY
jgi:ribosome recycling factor